MWNRQGKIWYSEQEYKRIEFKLRAIEDICSKKKLHVNPKDILEIIKR